MATPLELEALIRAALPCEYLAVEGDGRHFQATVVSSAFFGKSMVQQHQMVYGALGELMCEEVHALSILSYTPEQWSKNP